MGSPKSAVAKGCAPTRNRDERAASSGGVLGIQGRHHSWRRRGKENKGPHHAAEGPLGGHPAAQLAVDLPRPRAPRDVILRARLGSIAFIPGAMRLAALTNILLAPSL
jgi:hypothetical protein